MECYTSSGKLFVRCWAYPWPCPMERYFNPEVMREESELRQRVGQKLKLCPEQYLPIVEGAIDGALKIEKPNEETEGV